MHIARAITRRRRAPLGLSVALAFGCCLIGAEASPTGNTYAVGPGKPFARIEAALAHGGACATIEVYPQAGNAPYERVACFVTANRVTIRAVVPAGAPRIPLTGDGFDYSGVGRTPRAIVQFMPGADGGRLEGFELRGARNGSHNGAGVRIAGANDVTIEHCTIHGNDMGIMSNGDGTRARGRNQRIAHCHLHHNGTDRDPGQNHNLYLGGASVTLRFCEVSHSVTGHNIKSRAHHTRVEYCWVHDSGNREFDLVDAVETALPQSHAVLVGNCIRKADDLAGNRAVIHFGQDGGGAHDGTLHLAFNTIDTPYRAPVIQLTAPGARAHLVGNIVWDRADPGAQVLAAASHGASLAHVAGSHNWLAASFADVAALRLDPASTRFGARGYSPPFTDPASGDYGLTDHRSSTPRFVDAGPERGSVRLPGLPGAPVVKEAARLLATVQYGPGQVSRPRTDPGRHDLGACESLRVR